MNRRKPWKTCSFQEFTLSAYIYQDVAADGPIIEFEGVHPEKTGFSLGIVNRKLHVDLSPETDEHVWIDHIAVEEKKWHHVGVTFSGDEGRVSWSNLRLYELLLKDLTANLGSSQ